MAILGYFDVFPEKTRTELRTATFTGGASDDGLPNGTYVFTEYYCTDPKCNCERVLVKVFRVRSEKAPPDEVATINYSWNPHGDPTWSIINAEMPNPFLDPFHRQVSYAPRLLEFWSAMIDRDNEYASRLKRHYREIRAAMAQSKGKRPTPGPTDGGAYKRSASPLTKGVRRTSKRRARKR